MSTASALPSVWWCLANERATKAEVSQDVVLDPHSGSPCELTSAFEQIKLCLPDSLEAAGIDVFCLVPIARVVEASCRV